MVRFVHTSDWQLGMTRWFLGPDAQPRFTAARIDAIRTIGRLVREREAAFVVVAGDVFESNHLDRAIVGRALEAMHEIGVPVLLLPGNHDPLDPSSIMTSDEFAARAGDHVTVLNDTQPVLVQPGVEVVGAPWHSKKPLHDLASEAAYDQDPATGVTRILVAHGATAQFRGSEHDPARIDHRRLEAAIDDGRLHYVALGDRHSTTSVGDSGRIWYAGAPEPTAHVEDDPGNVLVVECAPDTCVVEPVQVGTWRFVTKHADLTDAEDVQAFAMWLRTQSSRDRTILRLALRGGVSLADAAALEAVIEEAAEVYASVEHWEGHHDLVVLPGADEFGDELSGFARRAADDLAQAADGTEHDPTTARDALALLYRLSHATKEASR